VIKSYYITINREDKGNLYSTFFCSPITALLEFFWLDRADSYMFHLGATVSILDFFIAVVVDVPYIIKSSTENTRQERTKQYREQLDSEKVLQDQKTIFGRAALVVRGKRMTDGKINEKLDNDEQNDPMSSCYKAMMFILMLCIPILLHFVRFLHFFVGPDDIYEKVGGCKFGFISVWKPEKFYCEVDGEFYHLVNPICVSVVFKKKLQVLQNDDPESVSILKSLLTSGKERARDLGSDVATGVKGAVNEVKKRAGSKDVN